MATECVPLCIAVKDICNRRSVIAAPIIVVLIYLFAIQNRCRFLADVLPPNRAVLAFWQKIGDLTAFKALQLHGDCTVHIVCFIVRQIVAVFHDTVIRTALYNSAQTGAAPIDNHSGIITVSDGALTCEPANTAGHTWFNRTDRHRLAVAIFQCTFQRNAANAANHVSSIKIRINYADIPDRASRHCRK